MSETPLRVGEELRKKMGGGTKRVKVEKLLKDRAVLVPLGGSRRSACASRWVVSLGDDGLPDGYRRPTASEVSDTTTRRSM